MKVVYQVFESTVMEPDGQQRKAYGIRVCRQLDGEWSCESEMPDITGDTDFITRLADTCTSCELDPIHLRDVVHDALWIPGEEA